ncbi:hypothetical protein EJ08DRAFT_169104 [Tothia fuscella]|uniref:AAA+ ATPase domain-containing protein n=1 Tax=Tothia fuscella TaxID=1048955 RepID=A0A9P4TZZ3_9PEZI|nr:hypothetical protein EJ08DRAFT_169104 [Tothia fuscella]
MTNAALTITNPLVLYRALVATNRISPDPSQLRLALHLQKLYERLKDYEPAVAYKKRLSQVGRILKDEKGGDSEVTKSIGLRGIWTSLLEQKAKRDSLALTRVLNSHDAALQLDSPKGLMLHGEVGTGKSMLIDLFADCLPTTKKRRWHFNTFMLETFARLEQLRRSQSSGGSLSSDEYSLLWLARDLIKTSPILFLDEFQLPDRTSSKIMSNLMTGFFQLGGVLIATSNRMPDELAKAAGMQFVQPSNRMDSLGWRLGLRGSRSKSKGGMFAGEGEFGQFLELLKARCDVWEIDGGRDYRRSEAEKKAEVEKDFSQAENIAIPGMMSNFGTGSHSAPPAAPTGKAALELPTNYFVQETASSSSLPKDFSDAQLTATGNTFISSNDIPWQPSSLTVYGRTVYIPRSHNNVASFTFTEICATHLGPADYISLSSTYHTIIITDIPILTSLLKNEARRFITLLDALYEARCKLLIFAAAGPDDIFFPETRRKRVVGEGEEEETPDQDATYSETFSDIHQDLTAPFRPNISSYTNGSDPDYTHARLQGLLAEDALEDDPPNRVRRTTGLTDEEIRDVRSTPNFVQTVAFIGEDEKFAYKRAASRLWEMCSRKWWDRTEEGWWRPLPVGLRSWEKTSSSSSTLTLLEENSKGLDLARDHVPVGAGEGMGGERGVNEKDDEVLFRHGASPFRNAKEAPPKFDWTHIWGTGVPWGKRAGAWGKGVEGLKDRKKGSGDGKGDGQGENRE